jgi:hypothetical protein
MDFMKLEPTPDGESYRTFFHNENQQNDVTKGEIPKQMGCPIMKNENEVSYMSVCMTRKYDLSPFCLDLLLNRCYLKVTCFVVLAAAYNNVLL